MAEGDRFEPNDFEKMSGLINDGDDDKEVDTTGHFWLGGASTPAPYHDSEQMEMETRHHEHSGLPSYDEKTPLITDDYIQMMLSALREDPITGLIDTTKADTSVNPLSEEDKEIQFQRVKKLIKARYPNADVDSLVIRYSTKKPMHIVVLGPREWRD